MWARMWMHEPIKTFLTIFIDYEHATIKSQREGSILNQFVNLLSRTIKMKL